MEIWVPVQSDVSHVSSPASTLISHGINTTSRENIFKDVYFLIKSTQLNVNNRPGGGGTGLKSHHSGGRGRLAWSTKLVPGQ